MKNTRQRIIITDVYPEIECGHFAIKRVIGENVKVEANIFADGHDEIAAILLVGKESSDWQSLPFQFLSNDRWGAAFKVTELGVYHYTIKAWIDEFKTWQKNLKKKFEAGQDIKIELKIGYNLIQKTAEQTLQSHQKKFRLYLSQLNDTTALAAAYEMSQAPELSQLMTEHYKPDHFTQYEHELKVRVDRAKARFSAWYELFPRSWSLDTKKPGTFKDVTQQLNDIKQLGFDVVYLPPIHPISKINRKGRNNTLTASAEDPGSPWAIGDSSGGHMALHPELGNMDDFKNLIKAANDLEIDIAMDFALQCSPDHPYLTQHKNWFKQRPDGTLQYAENPPKKYQDIYPFNFDSEDWYGLWQECEKILLFWIKQGVKIFRVDNPHTKPFKFWQWLLAEIKQAHPEVIFLSEAFTRPAVMYHLAKLGFTQSYTYFTWRNTKQELTEYLTELSQPPVYDFFIPNFWPNTPDILHDYLQKGGRPAFIIRFILAATLGTNYGIYGPAFELCINQPLHEGSEEYLDSEKYEIKHWNRNQTGNIKEIIAATNKIRREHPALQNLSSLQFHNIDNSQLLCYSKHNANFSDIILVIINLDPQYTQSGWAEINTELWNFSQATYQVNDLLTQQTYTWNEKRNYVRLDPSMPVHLFQIKK